ncbi:GAF domain-containing protein [Halobaculum litoreum]|uniref:GAF domain-containing protein n=1 Tax=Halobaculum litoreum TaxID=3031998 RepID=A0ABD5XVN6_9EURY|nr:GAF domain-containing protein [Halobaculum sp. DT92]
MSDLEVIEDDTPLGKFVYDGFAEEFQPRFEEIAEETGLDSVLFIRSTPTHTRIVCTAGPYAETYVKGAKGTKSVNEGEHEAYCERVHNTGEELYIPDAEQEAEWVGADEFDMFGLRSYYGVPVRYGDEVVGTVCALDEEVYDFEAGSPSAVELLRDVRDDAEAAIDAHFG